MIAQEILDAVEALELPQVDDVDLTTARMESGYLVVSGRVAMPLDGVAWSLDRTSDIPILDDLGAPMGILCLVSGRPPRPHSELTRYEFTALLADAANPQALLSPARFSRDYAVIDEHDLPRYLEQFHDGSALWGGFHHGTSPAEEFGHVTEIKARKGLLAPTAHHANSFRRLTRATGPREQFLQTYHTIELLFDYVTFRRFVKAGDDLLDFGKIMSAYQRSELDRLKAIVKDFCLDLTAMTATMLRLEPFLARAEDMFQLHGKEGNPLKDERRWQAFRSMVEAGAIERPQNGSLHLKADQFEELITHVAAYQIYRLRSSIAHSRIGEYLLTDEDDAMIAGYGIPLVTEVASQVFGSSGMAELLA